MANLLVNKQINFNIEKRLLYELKIPAYEGENYSPDSEYSMYASLIDNIIDYICEINGSLKIGKNIPGTNIPVVDENILFNIGKYYKHPYYLALGQDIAQCVR